MSYQPSHPCPVCSSLDVIVIGTKDGKSGESLITLECRKCGLGRIDPLPSQQTLRQWYTDQYRQEYKSRVSPQMRHVLRAGRLAMSRWQWAANQMNLSPTAPTLDIGASSGEFVFLMQTMGMDANGVEPHLGYGGHAREVLGLQVKPGTLEDALGYYEHGSQNLVTMFHVFEHVVNPRETLAQISALLKPGGYFLVEVPDATKLCAPHTMFFRAHTLYFSQQVMKAVLRTSGFQVLSYREHQGNLLFLAQKPALELNPLARSDASPEVHSLSKAQSQRRWLSYLARELVSLSLFRRLWIQMEERLFALRYKHYKDLLTSIYAKADKSIRI